MKIDKLHIALLIFIFCIISFSIYQYENPKIKTIESLKTITPPKIKEIQSVLHVPEYIASNAQKVIKETNPIKSIETSNPEKTIQDIQKESPNLKTIITQPNNKTVNVYQIKNPPENSISAWAIGGNNIYGGGVEYNRQRLGIGVGYIHIPNKNEVVGIIKYKAVIW